MIFSKSKLNIRRNWLNKTTFINFKLKTTFFFFCFQVEDLRNGTGFVTLSEDHCSNIFHRNIKQTIENRSTKKVYI